MYQQEVSKGVQAVLQQAQAVEQRSWAMRIVLPNAIAALILTALGVGVG